MNMPVRLFGIETEYGIMREGPEASDPVVESMELVRAYAEEPFRQSWDYRDEDPHNDQRGFHVQELEQDIEERQFADWDASRAFSFHEMKSDLVLTNGARFYNDHTHPEYSTPECRTLADIIAHDRAGDRIVREAASRRNRALERASVQLYKNNTDFHGHSYGCHDNYLVSREIPFAELVAGLLPFLVSRQVLCGAGKIGKESQNVPYQPGPFQLSQRADFMETDLSVDTMHNRPILNTRDEPHANRAKYRRLHLILGDANMCEYATALKIGMTRVVLDLIANKLAPVIALDHPVHAIKTISSDTDLKVAVSCHKRGYFTGIDLQALYLEHAERHLSSRDPETDWIIQQWGDALESLRHDRLKLVGRIDWITKHWLIESFVESERLEWSDPWLASLDLEYHNLNPDRGLYWGLEAEGKTWRLCDEATVEAAIHNGPFDTRGGLRGLCVRRFRPRIKRIQWEKIQFQDGSDMHTLDLSDSFDPDDIKTLRKHVCEAPTPASFCR